MKSMISKAVVQKSLNQKKLTLLKGQTAFEAVCPFDGFI